MKRILLMLALLSLPACVTTQPPAGTYTAPVLAQYNATPLKQAILALSQTAVSMNAASGPTHLSVADTTYVRDFALSSDATISSFVAGTGTLAAVKTGFDLLLTKLSADAKSTTLQAALAAVQTLIDAFPVGVA